MVGTGLGLLWDYFDGVAGDSGIMDGTAVVRRRLAGYLEAPRSASQVERVQVQVTMPRFARHSLQKNVRQATRP